MLRRLMLSLLRPGINLREKLFFLRYDLIATTFTAYLATCNIMAFFYGADLGEK